MSGFSTTPSGFTIYTVNTLNVGEPVQVLGGNSRRFCICFQQNTAGFEVLFNPTPVVNNWESMLVSNERERLFLHYYDLGDVIRGPWFYNNLGTFGQLASVTEFFII